MRPVGANPTSLLNFKRVKLNENDYRGFLMADPLNFKYIPNKKKSREICELAIDLYASNIQYVPKKHLDLDICERAYKGDRYCGDLMPPELYLSILFKKVQEAKKT